VDIFDCHGKIIISSVCELTGGSSFYDSDMVIFQESVDKALYDHTVKLCLHDAGDFRVSMAYVDGSLYAIRLTDMKIVFLNKFSVLNNDLATTYDIDYDYSMFDRLRVPREDVERPKLESSSLVDMYRSIPFSTIRVDYFCRFEFIVRLTYDLPRSPRSFGYDYTVEQYREAQWNFGVINTGRFESFSNLLWENARNKPELARFFSQARDTGTINFKNIGKISKIELDFCSSKFRLRGGMGMITLLHVLQELFDHNEFDCKRNDDHASIDTR